MIKPISFQQTAVEDMLRKVDNSIYEGEKEYLLVAPTGSGKTVTAGIYFEEYFKKHKDKDVGFLWISPGKGDLASQSRNSIEENFNYFNSLTLQDMLNQGEIRNRDVVFINWESINKKDNVSTREGEKTNIYDVLDNSNLDKFLIVVDESHESRNSIKANDLLNEFNPDIVIDVTATPRKDRVYNIFNTTKVDINDVISEEFIKNQIIINEGLEQLDVESVLKASIEKRQQIEDEYRKVEPDIPVPLMLVQIENDKKVDTDKGKTPKAIHIKNKLISLGVDDSKIAIWVSDKKQCQNLDDIKNSDVEVLIFKSAVATGFDAPRAHVLTKLREPSKGGETFTVQVLGRILRTINKEFYGNKDIDSAFIFTEFHDYEYKLEIDDDLAERVKAGKTLAFIKQEYQDVKINIPMIKKERRLEHTFNSSILKKRIDKVLTKDRVNELELDDNKLKESISRGILQSSNLLDEGYFEDIEEGSVYKSNKKIKEEFIKKTKKISSHIKLTNYVLNALKQSDKVSFPIDAMKMYLSNETRVNELVLTALDDYFETELKRKTNDTLCYELPKEVYYTGVLDSVSKNHLYTQQPNLSITKTNSSSEEIFGNYLSNNENVKYWFKNNVGGDNFSVVYNASSFENKEYYPDFFVVDNDNKLYIVDVKAPIKNNTSNDYKDIEAKYVSGKDYESNYLDDVIRQGFNNFEFSMIKFKDEVPFICKTNSYNEKFEDSDFWVKFL